MFNYEDEYKEVWFLDFEFAAPSGENPEVVCMVAREMFSGLLIRLSQEALNSLTSPPFAVGADTLFVSYYSTAEWNCFLQLGWPIPARTVDLYVEFKNKFNGRDTVAGFSLLGALAQHGLSAIDAAEKNEMRQLAMRGGPYSPLEMEQLLDYCQSDVDSLKRLFAAMLEGIDFPRALLRGRYAAAVARMEFQGVPIDHRQLKELRENWDRIRNQLIAEIDQDFGVYEGQAFRSKRFEEWLLGKSIPWPKAENGRLKLDRETFRQQAKKFPAVAPLHELRHAMSELRIEKLAVGPDGRNRCLLSPFASRTSRNQPGTNKFIFGPSSWLRSLIKPPPGKAIVYVDWSMQELGIAAALSGDAAMISAYESGDPYLALAKLAKAVPDWATKQSHPEERAMYKICSLGVQYGMSEFGLANALGVPPVVARSLLRRHKEAYPVYWEWSQANVDTAMLRGTTKTVFGWTLHVTSNTKSKTLANFPCQANGAEMLRLACCLTTEAGIKVCCPVHDALLIEADVNHVESVVAKTQRLMAEASRIVLDGFELRSDAEIVRYPDRYSDERGRLMWEKVVALCNSAA